MMASLPVWNSRLKRESDPDKKYFIYLLIFLPSLTGFSISSESSLLILLPSQLPPYFSNNGAFPKPITLERIKIDPYTVCSCKVEQSLASSCKISQSSAVIAR